jgi:hypothetical protein
MTRVLTALLIALAAAPAAHSAPVRHPRPAAHAGTVTQPPGAADNPTRPPRPGGTRTLDAIHIEGELPLPQVMFITARDQRRFLEFEHHRYQRTTLELLRGTPLPNRVVVTSPPPVQR